MSYIADIPMDKLLTHGVGTDKELTSKIDVIAVENIEFHKNFIRAFISSDMVSKNSNIQKYERHLIKHSNKGYIHYSKAPRKLKKQVRKALLQQFFYSAVSKYELDYNIHFDNYMRTVYEIYGQPSIILTAKCYNKFWDITHRKYNKFIMSLGC